MARVLIYDLWRWYPMFQYVSFGFDIGHTIFSTGTTHQIHNAAQLGPPNFQTCSSGSWHESDRTFDPCWFKNATNWALRPLTSELPKYCQSPTSSLQGRNPWETEWMIKGSPKKQLNMIDTYLLQPLHKKKSSTVDDLLVAKRNYCISCLTTPHLLVAMYCNQLVFVSSLVCNVLAKTRNHSTVERYLVHTIFIKFYQYFIKYFCFSTAYFACLSIPPLRPRNPGATGRVEVNLRSWIQVFIALYSFIIKESEQKWGQSYRGILQLNMPFLWK